MATLIITMAVSAPWKADTVHRQAKKAKKANEEQDRFEISALPQNAAVVRERVRKAAAQAGFTGVVLDDIEVAVGEAVTNAVLYGSPSATSRIVVVTHFTADPEPTFQVDISDQGKGFDPEMIRRDDNLDALGGRGLRLMRALLDEVILHYDGHGMTVRLVKKLSHH